MHVCGQTARPARAVQEYQSAQVGDKCRIEPTEPPYAPKFDVESENAATFFRTTRNLQLWAKIWILELGS